MKMKRRFFGYASMLLLSTFAQAGSVEIPNAGKLDSKFIPSMEGVPFELVLEIQDIPQNGVIVSHGDRWFGYALWVEDGKPVFSVRNDGELQEIRGAKLELHRSEKQERNYEFRYRFRVGINIDSKLYLSYDKTCLEKDANGLLYQQPKGDLEIGTDAETPVAPYPKTMQDSVQIRNAELFTGMDVEVSNRSPGGNLKTRWYEQAAEGEGWTSYPRPQLVRGEALPGKDWINLNGMWQYSVTPASLPWPEQWEGDIRVPYAIESQLSGVQKRVGAKNALWYRKAIQLSGDQQEQEVLLLHFGAVDFECQVWANGKYIGIHRGGFDPFSFDISKAIAETRGEVELVIRVWDPTDEGDQPRGKQVSVGAGRGIWYTPVTGIWQTVWLEWAPVARIEAVTHEVRLDDQQLIVDLELSDAVEASDSLLVTLKNGDRELRRVEARVGRKVTLDASGLQKWSPNNPYLYDVEVQLLRSDRVLDQVTSYIAYREVKIAKAKDGYRRIFLNGEPLFLYGPLDQGWWPDGLLTPPTEQAAYYDIDKTRDLGFNVIRKHIKIEPALWYHHCDKVGMLVWQDMPSGFSGPPHGPSHVMSLDTHDWSRSPESMIQYEREYVEMIHDLKPFPSIIMWGVFNEGWGQYDTERVFDWAKHLDSTRITHSVSGWTDRGAGPIVDAHVYPGPGITDTDFIAENRVSALGEFGGLGHAIEGHLWAHKQNWGYRNIDDIDRLTRTYYEQTEVLKSLKSRGLAAAIYTQTTDVESEINGLMTYDREVLKVDEARFRKMHQSVIRGDYPSTRLLPVEGVSDGLWRYSTEVSDDHWYEKPLPDAGFGTLPFGANPSEVRKIQTVVDTQKLYLQTTFQSGQQFSALLVRHAVAAKRMTIYLNGKWIRTIDILNVTREKLENLIDGVGELLEEDNLLSIEVEGNRAIDFVEFELWGIEK